MMNNSLFFDTHCHLPDECSEEQATAILQENQSAGVGRMLFAGTSTADCPRYIRWASEHPESIVTSVGVHPEEAHCWREDTIEKLRQWASSPGVVAIGEIGLDAHYDATSPQEQEEVFIQCLKLADETGLPVVIHCREAFERCHALIERYLAVEHPIQIHSFSDGPSELEKWLHRNSRFSYNGMVTFKKAENIRETVRIVPLERLMLETDAPYLTPVPFRGQPNSSKYLPYIAQRIAEERQLSMEQVAEITWENACRFLGLN